LTSSPFLSSPVLVVTQLDDATADGVIEELNRRSVPVVRLDPGDLPAAVTVHARVGDAGLVGGLRTTTRAADLDRVRSVYWRRPSPYNPPEVVEPRTPAGAWSRPVTGWAACSPLCRARTTSTTPGATGTRSTNPPNWTIRTEWNARAASHTNYGTGRPVTDHGP